MNTIFYGPPGTGKTYIVSEQAAEICGKVRADYSALVEADRIAFITFTSPTAMRISSKAFALLPRTAR